MADTEDAPSKKRLIAGDAVVLARRYANAFYELADNSKVLDLVAADLRLLNSLEEIGAVFQKVSQNPQFKRSQLVTLMLRVGEAANVQPLTANFLGLMAQNRRLSLLGPVIESFLIEVALRRGESFADVRVARPLSSDQIEQLKKRLFELAGGTVHLSIQEDKSLLGGVIVKMGSQLIDASLRGKLNRLERQLQSQINASYKGAA